MGEVNQGNGRADRQDRSLELTYIGVRRAVVGEQGNDRHPVGLVAVSRSQAVSRLARFYTVLIRAGSGEVRRKTTSLLSEGEADPSGPPGASDTALLGSALRDEAGDGQEIDLSESGEANRHPGPVGVVAMSQDFARDSNPPDRVEFPLQPALLADLPYRSHAPHPPHHISLH